MIINVIRETSVGLTSFITYEIDGNIRKLNTDVTSVKMFMHMFEQNKFNELLERDFSLKPQDYEMFLIYILEHNHDELKNIASRYVHKYQNSYK